MRVTNNLGLPLPIVRAVEYNDHTPSGADYSASKLISPPRINVLRGLYDDEIFEDASDRIWLLMGTIIHDILDRASKQESVEEGAALKAGEIDEYQKDNPVLRLYEKALQADMDGYSVAGRMDVYEDGVIDDYKVTSIYSAREVKPEWENQLNIYGWLARADGLKVTGLRIVCILRDWSLRAAQRNPDLAQTQVTILDVPMWEPERAEAYVRERIKAHTEARENGLPDCTDDERWMTETVHAVMKRGRKSAVRLFNNAKDAAARAAELGTGHSVEVRYGEPRRCLGYCPVAQFCDQFIQWKAENKHGDA